MTITSEKLNILVKWLVKTMKINTFLYSIVLLVIITYFSYAAVTRLFYQQDEWQSIGNNIVLNNFFNLFSHTNLLQIVSVQERFGSNILSFLLMGRFAFNTGLMGLYSIFFHILNVVLVYLIIRRWVIRDTIFSFMAVLFFAVSDVSMSTVSWFGTSLGTLPAVTLILIALIFYFHYLETNRVKWIILTLGFLYFSLFLKEIGVFLLLFLPLAILLFQPKKTLPRAAGYFFVVFLLVVLLRIINLVFLSDRSGELFITSSKQNFILTLIIRMIMYPLTSFSLTFIPPKPFVAFTKKFISVYYPFVPSEHFNLIAQTIVLDMFAILLTCIFLFTIYISIKKEHTDRKKMTFFWIVFFVLSFLPYVLLDKSYAYLESRYYYLANLPGAIILGMMGLSLKKVLDKWSLGTLVILLMACFLILHIKYLNDDLNQLVVVSKERTDFFTQFSSIKPQLTNKKNIFYITGDHDYYIPGNHIPFQQGMGYTLMVWYYKSGKIPKEFIQDRFLWDLNTQGYREIGDFGFGFFYDINSLKSSLSENKFEKNNIFSLYYDSKLKRVKLNNDFQ